MAYSLIITLVCMRLYCKGLYCIIAEVPGVARKIKKNVEKNQFLNWFPQQCQPIWSRRLASCNRYICIFMIEELYFTKI